MTAGSGRDLDHVVMPVASLGEARRVFEALRFRVAPDAAHPFGTGNACIFFEDGSYVEPLAVLDRDLAETRASEGNAFLRRDLAYRLRHALPGLTGIALKSADALADQDRFGGAGFDGGDILEFGGPLRGPGGDEAELRFRLAFAADPSAPAMFVFACQRLFDFELNRSALTAHPNGVRGIARLVFVAGDPSGIRPFFETVLEARDAVANSLGFSMTFGGRTIEVLAPEGLAARYGVAGRGEGGPQFVGIVLSTDRAGEIPSIAAACGLTSQETLGRHVVPMGGAEVFFAFEPAT